jgi:poly-gamma-glutamate capsule biosynthesis protein CapA/YwtB (metallophosphatase superfamily)
MREPRWLVPIAAALAGGLLAGCFGGTVRNPPEAGGSSRPSPGRHRQERHQRQVAEGGSEAGEKVVTIAAVGDTAMGITPALPPEPATYLDPIKGELSGDVVFGNLEGTLTNAYESPKCGAGSSECFAFRAPPEYAKYLAAAGFTVMNDANNHSFDFGQQGEDETVAALHGAGISQTGLPGEITIVGAGGRRVAFLGFAPYSNTASLTDLATADS